MFAPPPNQTDYITFLYNVVGIPTAALPSDSIYIATSLAVSMEWVNGKLSCASGLLYVLAVYNLAADRLINYAQDVNGQTYFEALRAKLNLNQPIYGVVSSTSDESTSTSLLNTEAMKNMTVGDLQNMQTPYGREYLAIAQSVGTLWGLT